jgi:thermolabile hemolysin
MKKFSIVCGLMIAASLIPVQAIAANFSQIVVYGDSLSDIGKAYTATGAPPYGAVTGGRFSNGPLWIEYLAADLGIEIDPSTNFAVGGATTGTNNTIQPALGGVQDRVTSNSISDPNALYIVWAGANDYLGGGIANPAIPVTNLSSEISTLISRGAKNILVPNLSNLGKLPVTQNTVNSLSLDLLTQSHNAGLAASLNTLSRDNPGVKLSLLDVNSLFNRVVADPSSFGFKNVTDGCVFASGSTSNNYLFWDTIHPTTAAHQLISKLALQTLKSTSVTSALNGN